MKTLGPAMSAGSTSWNSGWPPVSVQKSIRELSRIERTSPQLWSLRASLKVSSGGMWMGGWVASLPSVCVRSGVEGIGWSFVVSGGLERRERESERKERGTQRKREA